MLSSARNKENHLDMVPQPVVRAPDDGDRTVVIGPTGCGKTQLACDILATQNWDQIPWVFMDYKRDPFVLDLIQYLRKHGCKVPEIRVDAKPPTKPGLYYLPLRPLEDDAIIETWLKKVYEKGDLGLYLDEGYALPKNSRFFDIILTQGRALHIPVICLYQRPSHMTRFAVSQSTFRAYFYTDDERDSDVAARFIRPAKGENGQVVDVYTELPRYYSLWFDVARKTTSVIRPASEKMVIYNYFLNRMRPKPPQNGQETVQITRMLV